MLSQIALVNMRPNQLGVGRASQGVKLISSNGLYTRLLRSQSETASTSEKLNGVHVAALSSPDANGTSKAVFVTFAFFSSCRYTERPSL